METVPPSHTRIPTLLDAALYYAGRGWSVFPCHSPTAQGCSCRREGCPNQGKHPRTRNGLTDATTDASTIQKWWQMWPDANIAVRTGAVSGVVVLDEDTYKGGDLHDLERGHTSLPDTLEQLTGGGGRQLFFQHPGVRIKNSVSDLGVGLDIRGDGGYVIVPPSQHASGRRYQWEVTHGPREMRLAPMPAWLQVLCTDTRYATGVDVGDTIEAGQRNGHLFRAGCSMRARGFTEAAIYAALMAMNDTQCQPPLAAEEVRTITASCVRYPSGATNGQHPATTGDQPHPPTAPTTPFGDVYYAEWFQRLYGHKWRYCALWKSWLEWIGTHWERDTQGRILEDARATLRYVGHIAIDTDNRDLLKHYAKSMNHQPLTRMISQASTLPGMGIDPALLDQHPFLLNCRNGTVHLGTGTLEPHQPTDYLTRCLPLDYEPLALAPIWQAFLWRIMGGTVEADTDNDSTALLEQRSSQDQRAHRLIAFLQRALGYTLSGDISEECLFLLHGTGRNGKSKLLSTIQHVLGPYAKTADMQSFLHKDRETVRNDLADLHGTRFVCASEVNEGARFAEGLVKQLTGGDRIKARFLFQEYFEFTPEFKLFLAFNHKPRIDGTDEAIWARVRLIPFEVKIPEAEQDKHLSDKLATELPGILAWCVAGCLAWQREGLGTPEEVTTATQEWRHESDYLQRFLDDNCYVNPQVRADATALYLAYKKWAEQTGEPVRSQTKFGTDLTVKGYAKVVGHGNKKYRLGLGLSSQEEREH